MPNEWFKFKDYEVSSVAEFIRLIIEELRSPYLFRGHADIKWELEPAIDRNEFSRLVGKLERQDHERLVMKEFKRLAAAHLDTIPKDAWEYLALARHHGLPTRLLDWSENPLVALYFAIESPAESDSVVWCYTYVEMDEPVDSEKCPDPIACNRLVLYRPPHVHPRIMTQAGVFTVHPPRFKEVENFWNLPLARVKLPNCARPKLRLELQRLGVHRATLFPDLDGVGQHIYQMWRNG